MPIVNAEYEEAVANRNRYTEQKGYVSYKGDQAYLDLLLAVFVAAEKWVESATTQEEREWAMGQSAIAERKYYDSKRRLM